MLVSRAKAETVSRRWLACTSMNTVDWPELSYAHWRDTLATLQLWTQVVGKIRLSLTPWLNHSWQVPLYVTARGLGTRPIYYGSDALEFEFDFLRSQLCVRSSADQERTVPLEAQTVADFYLRLMQLLRELNVKVSISDLPCELPQPIRFSQDRVHASYDAEAVRRFWRVLLQADRMLKLFRSGFIGKVSPVHFFWGSFDLAVTRFSGRRAPLHPGGVPGLRDEVTREAYSHEVSSAGFWPGNETYPQAAFYSYAYPEPARYRDYTVAAPGHYDDSLHEFILSYEAVRSASDPDALILNFLPGTYAAAADNAHWDRQALECPLGVPGRVRPLG
jgi:hypothetical protein